MPPKLSRKRQIRILGPGLGFQVLAGGFRFGREEEVEFGEGDDFVVEVGVDDFDVAGGGVVEEGGAVPGFGGGDDGLGEAFGVEGLVDADKHEGREVDVC